MKIGIITPRYPPTHAGGGEKSVQLLAEQLSKKGDGINVEVISFDGNITESINGITVKRLGEIPEHPYSAPNIFAYRQLKSIDIDFDLMHGYNMHLHPAIGRLSEKTNTPSVATLNAYPLLDRKDVNIEPSLKRRFYELSLLKIERPLLKRMIKHIDLLIPLTSPVREIYKEHSFSSSSFRVIPNMADPSFNIPASNESNSAQTTILFVGYLRQSKGVKVLIKSIADIDTNIQLKVVGDGPQRETLNDLIAKHNAGDRIDMIGEVPYDEVKRYYTEADVFVHPCLWPEPFSRTILEAMQAELPVVASNIGGVKEVIPEKRLRFQPGDPQALRESLKFAIENKHEIGDENKSRVNKYYTPDDVIAEIIDAYQSVADGTY